MASATAPTATSKTPARTSTSDIVKLTVALPAEAVASVAGIAQAKQKTKTQVLREAIALKMLIERELAVPGTRLLIERDGNTREIVFT